MNKILITALAGALTLGSLNLRAQTGATVDAPTVTANAAVVSQYMFRGQRYGGVSFQPSFELGNLFTNGSLGIWLNKPIANKVPNQSDPEVDFYGSYTATLGEGMSIVPGFTYYYYPRLVNTVHKATFEPSLAFNYTISGVKLTPKVYYDMDLEGPTFELSGAHSVALAALGVTVDLNATFGTYKLTDIVKDSRPSVKNWGSYFIGGVSVPFQITPTSKLTLGWAYHEGWQNKIKVGTYPQFQNPLMAARGVFSVNYSFSY